MPCSESIAPPVFVSAAMAVTSLDASLQACIASHEKDMLIAQSCMLVRPSEAYACIHMLPSQAAVHVQELVRGHDSQRAGLRG